MKRTGTRTGTGAVQYRSDTAPLYRPAKTATAYFIPNHKSKATKEEQNERMHQKKEDSLNSLLSACRKTHSYICTHGVTSAPVDSSYQSPSALRPDKILLPFMCTSSAKRRSKKERLLVSNALAQALLEIERPQTATFARLGAPVPLRPQILIRLALTAVSARGRWLSILRGKTPIPRIMKCVRL